MRPEHEATRAAFSLAALALLATTQCTTALPMDRGLGQASIGSPSRGYLVHPSHLSARGAGYVLFRTRAEGGQIFGTSRLIDAIQHGARAVRAARPGGAPLRVGDLSASRGGHLERHHSHRNGRDADLLFFATDLAGHSVLASGFVRYDAQGQSLDPAFPQRFDTARNWALVESLARDTEAGVVWIFCADRLRVLLLNHAQAHGRDPDIIARAGELLHQPGDSAPHDDHFHIRVACTPGERARGCRDGGPIWWWLAKDWDKSDSASADDDTLLDSLADLAPADPPGIEAARVTRIAASSR